MAGNLIGVDLGGTNVRAALISPEGQILARARRTSPQTADPSEVLDRIVEACREVRDSSPDGADAVGIGLPGIMDVATGVCSWSPNFDHWRHDVPIGPHVAEQLGIPARILNDAKCAVLGEHVYGAGKGARNLVMITLGTGIGGAFIVDGRLLMGPNGSIGEVGHHTVSPEGRRCGCGNFGCWEAMCARDAIIECAERKLQSGRPSLLRELSPDGDVTPALVAETAGQGDALAQEVLDEIGFWIGVGVANLINMLNPERFLIGGGIAAAGELLLAPIRRTVERRAVPLQRRTAQLMPATLGDDAGVLGAAAWALDATRNVTDLA